MASFLSLVRGPQRCRGSCRPAARRIQVSWPCWRMVMRPTAAALVQRAWPAWRRHQRLRVFVVVPISAFFELLSQVLTCKYSTPQRSACKALYSGTMLTFYSRIMNKRSPVVLATPAKTYFWKINRAMKGQVTATSALAAITEITKQTRLGIDEIKLPPIPWFGGRLWTVTRTCGNDPILVSDVAL